MWKFVKMLIGILLLPACGAVSVATFELYRVSGAAEVPQGLEAWALPAGFLLWVAIYFLLPRPTRTYVLGHELTHAFWSVMMGGRVKALKVRRDGGHVALTKTNFVITLAPYFFPFYTFLVIVGYYVAGIWLDVEAGRAGWLTAVGFTWAFHVTFTINMLAERQPDIREHGRIFSYVVILYMNALTVGSWMVLVGDPGLITYSDLLMREHAGAYRETWRQLASVWMVLAGWIESLKSAWR